MSDLLKTLCYFDLFEYPLTTFEVWQWLWMENGEGATLREVDDCLHELARSGQLETRDGFWFLNGRENLIQTRHDRHRVSIPKFARAKRMIKLFSWLPWVEGVAICNSLGYHNATKQSDIDLFVVTSPGAIWSTRLFVAGIMAVLGERPTVAHTADTVCLSFFISREAMDLQHLKKPNGDPYFTYWMTQLLPICGRGDIWEDFWSANTWIKQTLPNALSYQTTSPTWYRAMSATSFFTTRAFEPLAKKIQLLRLPKKLTEGAAQGTNIVINDQMLKFHANDRRDEYRLRWQELVKTLGI